MFAGRLHRDLERLLVDLVEDLVLLDVGTFREVALDQKALNPRAQLQLVDGLDPALEGGGVGEGDVFGADAEDEGSGGGFLELGERDRVVAHRDGVGPRSGGAVEAEEVHRRAADEARDEEVGGFVVDGLRRVELLDDPAAHDGDAVGERERLDLVMGHVDHGVAEAGVQADGGFPLVRMQ